MSSVPARSARAAPSKRIEAAQTTTGRLSRSWKTSSRSPKGGVGREPQHVATDGDQCRIGSENTAATTKRLRLSATIAAIDMAPWPPWAITSCGEGATPGAAGRKRAPPGAGSSIGSQMWAGTDWPRQWAPHSSIQARRSDTRSAQRRSERFGLRHRVRLDGDDAGAPPERGFAPTDLSDAQCRPEDSSTTDASRNARLEDGVPVPAVRGLTGVGRLVPGCHGPLPFERVPQRRAARARDPGLPTTCPGTGRRPRGLRHDGPTLRRVVARQAGVSTGDPPKCRAPRCTVEYYSLSSIVEGAWVRFARRVVAGAILAAGTVLVLVASAWACLPGSGGGSGKKLTVEPASARPGESITVSAPSSAVRGPVEVRLNSPAGPLLGTMVAGSPPAGDTVRMSVQIPAVTEPGQHALIAVQAGVKWDPAALGVAREDGTVPSTPRSRAAEEARNGTGLAGVAVIAGLAALPVGALMLAVRARRRRSPAVAADVRA